MAPSEVPTREWSELPELPLATIVYLLLPTLRDLFSFASVCRSWRSLLRSLSPSLLPSLPPLLLNPFISDRTPPHPSLTSTSSSNPPSPLQFSLPWHRFPPLSPSPPFLPAASSPSLTATSSSSPPPTLSSLSLMTSSLAPASSSLLSPLTATGYLTTTPHSLPPPSSPSSTFLLFFSRFAFLSCQFSTPGAAWTRHCFSPDISFITHVVTFKNRLFGINDRARLLELDLSSDQTHASSVVRFVNVLRPPRAPREFDRWNFGPQLVCTADQIFLVIFLFKRQTNASFLVPGRERIAEIEVYSLDWKRMEWVQVKRLQDCAIFIDRAGKAPILCEKPERWGGESNCVYVAGPGHYRWMRCSLDEERVASMRSLLFLDIRRSSWPSPIWIHPSLLY